MRNYKHLMVWFIVVLWLAPSPVSDAQDQALPYDIIFGIQNTREDEVFGEYEISSMDVYRLDSETLQQHLLVKGATNDYLAPSPSGSYVVFENYNTEQCINSCIYDMENETIRDLSQNFRPPKCRVCFPTGDFRQPTSVVWSPSGDQFAFAKWYAEPSGIYIYDINLQTFSLFREYPSYYLGRPSWSRDGTQLAIMWDSRYLEIYVADSGDLIDSMRGNAYFIGDTAATWSPMGEYLAVSGLGIYTMGSNLDNVTNLTPEQQPIINDDSIYFRTSPQWLPDESALIVEGATYGPGGSLYIYSIDINTLEKHRLAEGTQPQLSPDGQWIVFLGRGELNNDIYIIQPDGTNLRQITRTEETELFPQWLQ